LLFPVPQEFKLFKFFDRPGRAAHCWDLPEMDRRGSPGLPVEPNTFVIRHEFKLTNFGDWQSERGFDVVVEGSGTQPGLTLAGELVRAHGVLSILGYHQGGPRQVEVGMWNWKAIDVVNAHVRRRADLMESMRIGLELTAKGLIDLGALVTHRYTLDEVDRAYSDLQQKPPGFIKAVVRP